MMYNGIFLSAKVLTQETTDVGHKVLVYLSTMPTNYSFGGYLLKSFLKLYSVHRLNMLWDKISSEASNFIL